MGGYRLRRRVPSNEGRVFLGSAHELVADCFAIAFLKLFLCPSVSRFFDITNSTCEQNLRSEQIQIANKF
jgi:hypothetical protein